jgi:CheY-like chemotaxis protein
MKSLHVLVADDDTELCQYMVALVRNLGHYAEGVGDGRECLRRLATRNFDLLLLDLVMPEIDGAHVLDTVHERMPELKVVVTSAQDEEEVIRDILKKGAMAYLTKPIPEEALKQITTALASSQS